MSGMREKKTILCVDDEQTPLQFRRLVLESAGYKVLTALDCDAALAVFRHNHIDLVITDHLLPGRTGCEMAAEMKRDAPSIPIMLLTGLPEAPDGAGVTDEIMVKGTSPQQFLRQVAAALEA
jgi:CheY-like chemotaxis protein